MEVVVPWGGGNSNTAPFVAFGGSIREIWRQHSRNLLPCFCRYLAHLGQNYGEKVTRSDQF
jgi:hypothetical protein